MFSDLDISNSKTKALGLHPLRDLAVAGDPIRLQREAGDLRGAWDDGRGGRGKAVGNMGRSWENTGKSGESGENPVIFGKKHGKC